MYSTDINVKRSGKAIGLSIELRPGETVKQKVRIDPKRWDTVISHTKTWLQQQPVDHRVEVEIRTHDGNVIETSFAELKPVICY